MAADRLLPEDFRELEPFAREYALPLETQREEKRMRTAMDEHQRFYDAIVPRMDAISEYLKGMPPDADRMSSDQKNFFYLMLAFMETAVCVEIFGDVTSPMGIDYRRKVVLHETHHGRPA